MNYTASSKVLFVVCALFSANGCQKEKSSDREDFEPIKPVATFQVKSPNDDPTMKNAGSDDVDGELIRKGSLETLSAAGFRVAASLPTLNHRSAIPAKLRSAREIALRAMALKALFVWASAPESAVSSDDVNGYVDRNDLKKFLTTDELAILALPRQQAIDEHSGTVGWRLENMWSLCWLLGYDSPPSATTGQLPEKVTDEIIFEFLPKLDSSVDTLLAKAKPRTAAQVFAMEDLFYCAHNAVRSAQTGGREPFLKTFIL